MNLELAQMVSIVSYGNSYLRGATEIDPPELSTNQSTFYCVSSVSFVMLDGPKDVHKDVPLCKGTAGWFSYLKARQVRRLEIINIDWSKERPDLPDRCAAFFLGSGNWAILSKGTDGQHVWLPEWKTLKRCKKDGRDSDVTYRGVKLEPDVQSSVDSVSDAEEKLRTALVEARDFAKEKLMGMSWHECFQLAIDILNNENPDFTTFGDLVPSGLTMRAKRLIMASEQSWVFGGMGSWNDVGMDGDSEYDRISGLLYKAVINALATAASSP